MKSRRRFQALSDSPLILPYTPALNVVCSSRNAQSWPTEAPQEAPCRSILLRIDCTFEKSFMLPIRRLNLSFINLLPSHWLQFFTLSFNGNVRLCKAVGSLGRDRTILSSVAYSTIVVIASWKGVFATLVSRYMTAYE